MSRIWLAFFVVVPFLLSSGAVGAPASPAPSKPGTSFRDCSDCPEMVVVPAGRFTMGSPDAEQGRDPDEGPTVPVTISKSFALGRVEVTRGEFLRFVKETARPAGEGCWTLTGKAFRRRAEAGWAEPGFVQADDHPATCVSWDDASAYAAWLAARTGKAYRLPSEAEWEYAARGATTGAHAWAGGATAGCAFANMADAAAKAVMPAGWSFVTCNDGHVHTAPVARYRANGFGLHDMFGNVWEWTQDCYAASHSGAPTDGRPRLAQPCGQRVLRGGSWMVEPRLVRSAARFGEAPPYRAFFNGFRVARAL